MTTDQTLSLIKLLESHKQRQLKRLKLKVGDTIFYHWEGVGYCSAIVHKVIEFYELIYYIVEVPTGPPDGGRALMMLAPQDVFFREDLKDQYIAWDCRSAPYTHKPF